MGKNALIVLCAGKGERMGASIPKLLINVEGKPLLYWSLKNLEACSSLGAIILVAPAGYSKKFERFVKAWSLKKVIRIVEGGKERVDSTRNALPWIPAEYDWVGIHDGARAFVANHLVESCFKGARLTGAAILAFPSKDTIKFVDKNCRIVRTIPRSQVWGAQTPQVFSRQILEKMYSSKKKFMGSDHSLFTDDSLLAESLGVSVVVIPSSDENIKVTTPLDLAVAQAILKKRKRK